MTNGFDHVLFKKIKCSAGAVMNHNSHNFICIDGKHVFRMSVIAIAVEAAAIAAVNVATLLHGDPAGR